MLRGSFACRTSLRIFAGPLVFCLVACAAGCHKRTALAAPPLVIVPVPEERAPAPPEPVQAKQEPAADSAPPLATEDAAPAKTGRKPASRPKGNAVPAPSDTAAAQPAKPPAPTISPQLSADEQAAFQRKTNDNITNAEKNLQLVNGRQLTAAQRDLVDKIRAFVDEAHEAMRSADWDRANNLAQKAYVLSAELDNSL
jgi:hypothetical protein